jgi:hypothetical protein
VAITQDQAEGATQLLVGDPDDPTQPFAPTEYIWIRSGITLTAEAVKAALSLTDEAFRVAIRSDTICLLDQDLDGSAVTSFRVTPLREFVPGGVELVLQRSDGTTETFWSNGAHARGTTELHVTAEKPSFATITPIGGPSVVTERGSTPVPIEITARAGAGIRVANVTHLSEFLQTAFGFHQFVTRIEVEGLIAEAMRIDFGEVAQLLNEASESFLDGEDGQSFLDFGADIRALIPAHDGTIQVQGTSIQQNESEIILLAIDIEANETSITTNAAAITVNATEIALNVISIQANEDEIITNAASIIVNANNISLNVTSIQANEDEIITNASNISINAGTISLHTTSITQNADDIDDIDGRITTAEIDINALEAEIILKVEQGDTVTSLTLDLTGIYLDAFSVQSQNYNGSNIGWALFADGYGVIQQLFVRDYILFQTVGDGFFVQIDENGIKVRESPFETVISDGIVDADLEVWAGSYELTEVGSDVDAILADYLTSAEVNTTVQVISNLRKNDTTGFLEFKYRNVVVRSAGAESGWQALDFD